MKDTQLLQIVGYSQAGKTALISKLVEKLSKKDIKILTLKSAREHQYIFSEKDSDVFSQKGSTISIVAFKNIAQISIKKEIDVMNIIKNLAEIYQIDLILIEGFRELDLPKVIILTKNIIEEIDKINFEGIKYLFCPEEICIEYKEHINKIKNLYTCHIEEKHDSLINRIILDYNF